MSTKHFSWSKSGRCLRLTTYHPRSDERQKNPGLNLPGTPWDCSGLLRETFTFFIRLSYTSISEMASKLSEQSIQKLWFSQLCCCSSHCLQLHVSNKLKHINDKQNVQRKHKLHLFLNTQCCYQNYIILICFHPVFQISSFACNKITAFVLK